MREEAENTAAAEQGSRARVHPVLDKVADRIEYIAGLMAEHVWNRDSSRKLQKELGFEWGVLPHTIRNYSAEASRTLLEAVRERRAELATQAVETLLEVARSDNIAPGDKAAKVSASKVLLEFAGVDRPDEDKIQKHVVAGVGEATPDKAREVMKSLFGDVTPETSPSDLDEPGKS